MSQGLFTGEQPLSGLFNRGSGWSTQKQAPAFLDSQGARNGLRTLLERFLVRRAMWKRDEGEIRPRTAPLPVRSGLLGVRSADASTPRSAAIERTGCGQRARYSRR